MDRIISTITYKTMKQNSTKNAYMTPSIDIIEIILEGNILFDSEGGTAGGDAGKLDGWED